MKSMLRTVLGILLIAIITLALAGCTQQSESMTQQGDQGESEITKQELVEKAVSAQKGVKTSQFDTNISSNISGETSDGKFDMSIAYDMTGKVDRANKRMQATADITMHVPQQEGRTPRSVKTEMTIYSIEDTMYMKMTGPGMPDQWTKTPIPGGYWEQRISQQIELLKDSQIKILGEEKVENIDCYVVEFVPSKEKMWEIIQQQWPGQTTQDKPSNLDEIIKSMALKEWINKDTFLPVKEETQITMGMTAEQSQMTVPEAHQGFNMTMDRSATYHSYNEPISIELPSEAQNASEMPAGE